jgi:hypothetical protein
MTKAAEHRDPPCNGELEQALLGGLFISNAAFVHVEYLQPFHFFEPAHQRIFEVMAGLLREGKVATPLTVKPRLPADLLMAPGVTLNQYLARLAAESAGALCVPDYGREIYDLFRRREFIRVGESLIKGASGNGDPRAILEAAKVELEEIGSIDQGAAKFPGIKSSADFIRGFVPPDYLIDGLLQRRFIYSLTGKTGGGKTAVSLLFAAHVALGRPIGARHVEHGRVLYFAGENPDDICMRWIAMAGEFGFDIDAIPVHFIPGVFKISEMKDRITRDAKDIGEFSLVVVDTSAAYFEGDNENDNVQQGDHARRLRDNLTKLRGGPTVMVNCHPPKNATDDGLLPRGGGAFLAEVDGNLTCRKVDEAVELHTQGKFRGPEFSPISFTLRTVPAVKDSKGRKLSTVIARPLSDEGRDDLAAKNRSNENRLLIELAANPKATHAELAAKLEWFTRDGAPYKMMVTRLFASLEKDKLVTKKRGRHEITKAGRKAIE